MSHHLHHHHEEHDERGTVKPDGDRSDRRPDNVRRYVATAVVVLTVLAAVAVITATVAAYRAHVNRVEIASQADGRRKAVALFCGVDEALIRQGRQLLLASAALTGRTPADSDRIIRDRNGQPVRIIAGRYSRSIIRLGGPTARQRLARARAAADAYEDGIARAVIETQGRSDLLKHQGTVSLDCKRVLKVSKAGG